MHFHHLSPAEKYFIVQYLAALAIFCLIINSKIFTFSTRLICQLIDSIDWLVFEIWSDDRVLKQTLCLWTPDTCGLVYRLWIDSKLKSLIFAIGGTFGAREKFQLNLTRNERRVRLPFRAQLTDVATSIVEADCNLHVPLVSRVSFKWSSALNLANLISVAGNSPRKMCVYILFRLSIFSIKSFGS